MAQKTTTKTNKRKGNGEGTLYFSESKKCYVLQETLIDVFGNKYRKTFYGKTPTEVRNKSKKFIQELSLGIAKNQKTKNTSITIYQLVKEVIEKEFKQKMFSEATYTRKLYSLEIIKKHKIGNNPICKIKKSDIDDFFTFLTTYSNSVIKKVYSILNSGFKLAVKSNIIISNPLDDPFLKRPHSAKPDKNISAFTVDEQNEFLYALSQYQKLSNRCYYKYQFLIELYTGMRMGEINALKPEDVDLKNRVVNVSRTITRGINYQAKVGDKTKTAKGMRKVPLNDNAVAIFKVALAEYIPNEEGLLFYDTIHNKVIETSQVNIAFVRLCKKYNVASATNQHMLRHTFATRCIEAGVSAPVLKEWLGHTDISVTINTYCDVFAKLNNSSIEKLQTYTENEIVSLNSII